MGSYAPEGEEGENRLIGSSWSSPMPIAVGGGNDNEGILLHGWREWSLASGQAMELHSILRSVSG